ncbi:MAG: hypothetical protein ILO42_03410 [Clostridia bacterium]|nr:hypothetical protein [Clostridia bacterium]
MPEGRIVAFRCPGCGCGVMSAVDMLSLTGRAVPGRRAGFRLRCANPECGLKDSDVFGGLRSNRYPAGTVTAYA